MHHHPLTNSTATTSLHLWQQLDRRETLILGEREGNATCHPVNGQSNGQLVKLWSNGQLVKLWSNVQIWSKTGQARGL